MTRRPTIRASGEVVSATRARGAAMIKRCKPCARRHTFLWACRECGKKTCELLIRMLCDYKTREEKEKGDR